MSKKTRIIGDLLLKMYVKEIQYLGTDENGVIIIEFVNKPDQVVALVFAEMDTWNVIKNKFEKLIKSDGICVVCCETEKVKRFMKKESCGCESEILSNNSSMCQTCCEFVCRTCYDRQKGSKCPVCRQCLGKYFHEMEDEECWCNNDSDDE